MGLLQEAVAVALGCLETYFSWLLGPPPWAVFFLDLKFWFGLAGWYLVWAYWYSVDFQLRHEVVGCFHLKAGMVLGVDLAVLSLLQSAGAAGLVGLLSINYLNLKWTRGLFRARNLAAPQPGEEVVFAGDSIYEDPEAPMEQIWAIFAGQALLFLFLVYASFVSYRASGASYGFWIVAYLAVQMSAFYNRGGDSQLGRTWNLERFESLIRMNEGVAFRVRTRWVCKDAAELRLRHRMGLAVNTLFRDVIAFMTPILLMQSDSAMGFVQGAFAVNYISTLDDMQDLQVSIRRRDDPAIAGGLVHAGQMQWPVAGFFRWLFAG